MKRVAYYLCAPALCLALFWRVLVTWFRTDDFSLLSLASSVHDLRSLGYALFHPVAQGTVRVLSDRLFYLLFYTLFGVRAGPFHVGILLTWFIALGLAAEIGARVAGSRAAGLAAALLWTTSPIISTPLAWAAVYEVVLCAFFALAALYARVRFLETGAKAWRNAEWMLFLLGFGAQESMVVYPAAAVLYTWAVARRDVFKKGERGVFALFLPSVLFTAVHFFLIPKQPSEVYRLAVDARLPATLWTYFKMSMGPEQFGSTLIFGSVLAAFLIWRLWRRDWAVLFAAGWWVLWIAPVLPLPNHISDYYLTASMAGLAWLGGSALVAAWNAGSKAGIGARIGAAALVALYLFNAVPAIRDGTAWYLEHTARMRVAFRAMEEVGQEQPGATVIFKGVDNDLFQTGFQDHPFLLAGISQVFLAPGTENGIVAREDLGGIKSFVISPEDALRVIENGQARVIEITAGVPREITRSFDTVLRAEFLASHRDSADVGQPAYASRLGPTWNRIENGYRWMARSATVQLAGPSSPGERLYVTGYGAAAALAAGPVTLHFRADGQDLGSATVIQPDQKFAFDFALPGKLVGQYAMEVSIETSRVFRPVGETRDLGMIFGTFSVR